MAPQSIYEKYGGFARINRIVMAFYEASLESDEIGPYFDGVNMKRLIDHQTQFISWLLGGPASFDEAHLRNSHAHLGITDAHFDEMKRLFGLTMAGHGFEAGDVATVLERIEARRALVVVVPHVA